MYSRAIASIESVNNPYQVLDLVDSNAGDKAPIEVKQKNGGKNQLWYFPSESGLLEQGV